MTEKTNTALYLASASPRRRELLDQIGLKYTVLAQDIDESLLPGESAEQYVCRIAMAKAGAALADPARRSPLPVLAADTSVVCDGQVLGKPGNRQQAVDMLTLLSGRDHQVMTAVVAADNDRMEHRLVCTQVRFRKLTEQEVLAYWNSGEPCDKAGGYAIQGLGSMFVSHIEGSYTGVVGLPLFECMQLLENFGITAAELLKESST